MSASPADVARFSSDGVLLTIENQTTKASHPNALDVGTRELEMFFDNAADAEVMLQELFGFVGSVGRAHEAVQVDDTLGLGTTVDITQAMPTATLVDTSRRLDTRAVMRAYSFDMGSDAYAIEFVGLKGEGNTATLDSTAGSFDAISIRWDKTS